MGQSFVVFSIDTVRLQSMADSMESEENLNNADVLDAYLARLNTAIEAANEITMDRYVLNSAIAETTVISSESYGQGFGAGCKPELDPQDALDAGVSKDKNVEYFTSLEAFEKRIKDNSKEMAERNVDFNKIFKFDTAPPSLEMIEEDGIVSRVCEDFEVGITVYVYSAEENLMYYNAWDDSGDVEEGYLEDPEDEDWVFAPQFHKDLIPFIS